MSWSQSTEVTEPEPIMAASWELDRQPKICSGNHPIGQNMPAPNFPTGD